jgi:hypothetical protein
MTSAVVQFFIVLTTALLFIAINGLDAWLTSELHFIPGAHWISLSAGICVLATLLLGPIGVIGILVAYLLRNFIRFELIDMPHAVLEAVAQSIGPYLVYFVADRAFGLQASLANLTSKRLLLLIVACSAVCPSLQSLSMRVPVNSWDTLNHCLLMFAGNLTGALILTYMLKAISAALP